MAINRVDYPANLTDQDDFSAHGDLIETRFIDQVNAPQWVVSGNIPQGVVLQIGGVVYRADSDTAITGTASDYVQVTPAGATASAAYVANLTGVTWSAQYNGYYDASENLYLFDEGKALAAGQISAVFGRYLMQQPNGDVQVARNLAVDGTFDAGGDSNIGGSLDVVGTFDAGGDSNIGGSLDVVGTVNRSVKVLSRAATRTEAEWYNILDAYFSTKMNDSEIAPIAGSLGTAVATAVERFSTSRYDIIGFTTSGVFTKVSVDDGGVDSLTGELYAW